MTAQIIVNVVFFSILTWEQLVLNAVLFRAVMTHRMYPACCVTQKTDMI